VLAHAEGADEGIAIALVFAALWVGWIGWSRLRGRGFPRVGTGTAVALLLVSAGLAAASATVPRIVFPGPGAGPRPSSPATIAFRAPVEGARVTAARLEVLLDLRGGTVTDRTSTRLRPDVGHIHVSLDGRLLTMTASTSTVVALDDLDPGPHTLEAEFVAMDHGPFSPPVQARVTFTTGGAS
jgi:hypothetical protein